MLIFKWIMVEGIYDFMFQLRIYIDKLQNNVDPHNRHKHYLSLE